MIGDRLLYSLVPMAIGILIVFLVPLSFKNSSEPNGKGSYRFGSGEFFDPIADIYDITNRIMTFGSDIGWRKSMIEMLNITHSDNILDLATGTADVPILMLQQLALKSNQSVNILLPNPIHGLDPSRKMLEKGQAKINRLNYSDSIILHFGNSENMKQIFPKNNNFDAITMSFGIRNVEFRNKTLLEMKRLLRKGGRIAIMEFSAPQGGLLKPVANVFILYILPYLASIFSMFGTLVNSNTNYIQEYTYLKDSIYNFPTPASFRRILLEIGQFQTCDVVNVFQHIVYVYFCKV